jgi:hypothetical protein
MSNNPDHKTKITPWKANHKNYKFQSLTSSILNDGIKKNQLKKYKKQFESIHQTYDPSNQTKIILKKKIKKITWFNPS